MPQKSGVMHGRDHEHGAADPVRIAWEDVGAAGTGGGIQFDTHNTGDWLYVKTGLYDTTGYGINLDAGQYPFHIAGSGLTIDIPTAALGGSSLTVNAPDFNFQGVPGGDTSVDFVVNVGGNVVLTSGWGQISSYSDGLHLITNSLPILATAQGGAAIQLWATSGDVIIKGRFTGDLGVAGPILRVSHSPTGIPTYHIKTGATWVADL